MQQGSWLAPWCPPRRGTPSFHRRHPHPRPVNDVQNTQVSEAPEGAFRDVADGVVAEAQDAQAAQVGQALLVQPREVVEGQDPGGEREAHIVTAASPRHTLPLPAPEHGATVSRVSMGLEDTGRLTTLPRARGVVQLETPQRPTPSSWNVCVGPGDLKACEAMRMTQGHTTREP